MTAFSVLRVRANSEAYRCAVETIIRDIQRSLNKTLVDIAEDIECSLGTISNAVNKDSDLNPVYLARLGQVYGGAFLNPYLALFNSQAAAIERKPTVDVLPLIAKASLKIAEARDPNGPGGSTEVPQERRAYLPDLKHMQREVGCLISEIEAAA
jgi:hypothetical protein